MFFVFTSKDVAGALRLYQTTGKKVLKISLKRLASMCKDNFLWWLSQKEWQWWVIWGRGRERNEIGKRNILLCPVDFLPAYYFLKNFTTVSLISPSHPCLLNFHHLDLDSYDIFLLWIAARHIIVNFNFNYRNRRMELMKTFSILNNVK